MQKGQIFLSVEQGVADAPLSGAPRSINLEKNVKIIDVLYLRLETNVTIIFKYSLLFKYFHNSLTATCIENFK